MHISQCLKRALASSSFLLTLACSSDDQATGIGSATLPPAGGAGEAPAPAASGGASAGIGAPMAGSGNTVPTGIGAEQPAMPARAVPAPAVPAQPGASPATPNEPVQPSVPPAAPNEPVQPSAPPSVPNEPVQPSAPPVMPGEAPVGGMPGQILEPAKPPESAIDPSAPLTPVAFFPSKDRMDACSDASISIQFNRPPTIQAGGKIQIHEQGGGVFDSVEANPQNGLYFSDLAERSTDGKSFKTDVLDVVFNTVVFQPKGKLDYGKTYYVTVDEGMITDSSGTTFSVQQSDNWTFTVRAQAPASADAYTLAADGSGDYCSLEGVLQALPNEASAPRMVNVAKGVYPGIIRMGDSNVHFKGEGIDQSVFSHKNSSKMNGSREGIILSGSDVTFENLTIFNTYLKDSSGQQAEALRVASGSQRVFLNNVHLRSHQDTLRVDGDTVYMLGGKISGSTDPLWGTGTFYCDGCELSSRTSGHAFVVARSKKGFALVNCSVTKDVEDVVDTSLAQYHNGREPGKIAFVNCKIDDHITGWRRPENNEWYEYGNTKLQTGEPLTFGGKQLSAGSAELDALSSAQNWLGWSP